jgi:hypothetical protein
MVLVFSDKVLGIMRYDLIDHISVEVLINYPLVFRSLFLMKSGTKICLSSLRLLSTLMKHGIIPVVIDMFRLADFLTGEHAEYKDRNYNKHDKRSILQQQRGIGQAIVILSRNK